MEAQEDFNTLWLNRYNKVFETNYSLDEVMNQHYYIFNTMQTKLILKLLLDLTKEN